MEEEKPRSYNVLALYWTRAIVVALLGIVAYVTVSYCWHVCCDREAAFRDALRCSVRLLEGHNFIFWLQNGTLLGSTRLERLVLWDVDLDIGYKRPDNPNSFFVLMEQLDLQCFGAYSTVRTGVQNPMKIIRKCTKQICAEFRETVIKDGVVISGDGSSSEKELFPLEPCAVADVVTQCPHNASFYLREAYGNEWPTKSLIELF